METVEAKLRAFVAADGADEVERIGSRIAAQLFVELSETIGHPVRLDAETVCSDEDAITAAGDIRLADGTSAPLPIALNVRLSIDIRRSDGPSILAFVFVRAGDERVAPAGRDFVWYERPLGGAWECRGWDVDVYGELA